MRTHQPAIQCLFLCVLCVLRGECLCFAGALTPPAGPVSPTPGPEPRIPINATTTPGDAGSTFIITQRGSYYLTGNLNGEAGKNGIRIASQSVTIDLNGFSLIGVAGSSTGINADPAATHIVVRNGLVRDWDGAGVSLRSRSRVEDIEVWSSGGFGILVADNSRVARCGSLSNTSAGISASAPYCVIEDCRSTQNGTDGIVVGFGGHVVGCTASANANFGIRSTNTHAVIERCVVDGNDGTGILMADNAVVRECQSNSNGSDGIFVGFDSRVERCHAVQNTTDGIRAFSRSTIVENQCSGNGDGGTGSGIHLGASIVDCVIDGNQVDANDRGIEVDGTGNLIINNRASGNTTNNYEIAANNRYGQIVDITAAGAAAATGNAAASTLTTSAAHANFAY